MNRDAANTLQNAPSPWETAGTDALRLLQGHQVLETRLVGRDGIPAAGRARDGICQHQVAPRDDDSGDTWVNQGTPLCHPPHPGQQGCLWVEVKMGPSLAEVSFVTEDKLMVKEGVQDVVCPPLLSNPALGCSACCCNKGAVPEEAARAVAGQSPSTQASKEQQVTLGRHSGSSLLPEKGSRIPKSSCFLWVIDSQPQVLSMATEIADRGDPLG